MHVVQFQPLASSGNDTNKLQRFGIMPQWEIGWFKVPWKNSHSKISCYLPSKSKLCRKTWASLATRWEGEGVGYFMTISLKNILTTGEDCRSLSPLFWRKKKNHYNPRISSKKTLQPHHKKNKNFPNLFLISQFSSPKSIHNYCFPHS
jgi:hypothetical protein